MAGVLASLALLAGCPPPRQTAMPYPAPTAEAILTGLRESARVRSSIKLRSKIDHATDSGRVKGTILTIASRPDRVRFDALHPFGGVVAVLASDGREFQLLDVDKNRLFTGPALPCNVARLLRIALPGTELVALILGTLPPRDLAPGVKAGPVRWDPQAGAWALELRSPEGQGERDRLLVDPGATAPTVGPRQFALRGIERVSASGAKIFTVTYDGLEPARGARAGDVAFASRTHLMMPATKADLMLRHKEVELNSAIEERAFHLAAPAGIRPEPLTCSDEPGLAGPAAERPSVR
jgi:hypothetical protein